MNAPLHNILCNIVLMSSQHLYINHVIFLLSFHSISIWLEYTGDLTLALEPRVPPHDSELDLTVEELSEPPAGITLPPAGIFPDASDLQDQQGKPVKPSMSRSGEIQGYPQPTS